MSTDIKKQSKKAMFAALTMPIDKDAHIERSVTGLRRKDDIANINMNTAEPFLPGANLRKVKIEEIESAPDSWNFFKDQSQEVVVKLAASLLNEGQLAPIIIREYLYDDSNKKYQCLAGHTRIRAAQFLVNEGYVEWESLYAFVYTSDKCDDIQARRIIVFSNTAQRISMSPEEKQEAFVFEYLEEFNADRTQSTAKLTEIMAERYGLKRSQAYDLRKIAEKVIPEFRELIRKKTITINNAKYLSRIDEDTQHYLFETHKDNLTDRNFKIFLDKSREDIDEILRTNKPINDFSSKLKKIEETAETTIFNVQIPKGTETAFYKTIYRFYDKCKGKS